MTRARFIASFIGQEPKSATFAGLYSVGSWETLDYERYMRFPGNRELEKLGMSERAADMPDCLAFDLQPLGHFQEYVGRLIVNWPMPYQRWWRWGGRGTFPIAAIESESRFVQHMPEWTDMVLSWHELQCLPASWKHVLAQWRGIYMIYDTKRRSGYVGSAYGEDNILGRWHSYAKTGHGGNVELRRSAPANLRFSILQRTSPDLEIADIVALEASWKERLHTREYGLNRN